MKIDLEQFVDSDVHKYFVGRVSKINLPRYDYLPMHNLDPAKYDELIRISDHEYYCDLPNSWCAYIKMPMGSKVTSSFWSPYPYLFHDFPLQKIMTLSKNYIENIKEIGLMGRLWNLINAKEQKYRDQAFKQGSDPIKKLVDDYFQKSSSIEECELGFIKILGSDFIVNLINLSGSDYWIDLSIGELSNPYPYDNWPYDYDGLGRSLNIHGKSTGTLYKFNLRFRLKN